MSENPSLVEEFDQWLDENWDDSLTVGEWWERLGTSGWAAPSLPEHAYGRGLSRSDAQIVARRLAERRILGPPSGLGMLSAAPTIAAYGNAEQIEAFVRPIVTGQAAWCQLFSEPGAGSDLAGLSTRAVLDGDTWVINGQKVWTSSAHLADYGMLLARTDPSAPRHEGISWLGIDMRQGAAIEVRPLREMTGKSQFSEVFLDDARSPTAWVVGGVNNGWKVANATLAAERTGLGAGGHGGVLAAPGSRVGNLDKPVASFGTRRMRTGRDGAAGMVVAALERTRQLAAESGRIQDPPLRDRLVRLHMVQEVARLLGLRVRAARSAGRDIPGAINISKLLMSDIVTQAGDLSMTVLGAQGMLHAYDGRSRAVLDSIVGCPENAVITELAIFAPAPPIYGGTDEIQKNIIAERVLGLPRDKPAERTASAGRPKPALAAADAAPARRSAPANAMEE